MAIVFLYNIWGFQEVLAAIKDGVEVGTLCDIGDKLILDRTSKVFKKEKDVLKGSVEFYLIFSRFKQIFDLFYDAHR